jgi:hypothetical protein
MDSISVAAWVAHSAFWVLIALGWLVGDLGIRGTIIALAVWVTAYIGLSFLPSYGGALFPPFVAVIDIALVLVLFKGDVRIR